MPITDPPAYPEDTIVAVSTPPGRGGIGIIRLSGVRAVPVSEAFIRLAAAQGLQPRKATLAELLDTEGRLVDQVLVTFFPKPHSYTVEDVVEIACHGSPVSPGFHTFQPVALTTLRAKPDHRSAERCQHSPQASARAVEVRAVKTKSLRSLLPRFPGRE